VQSLTLVPKGFTQRIKVEKQLKNKIYHFVALIWPQGKKRIPINLASQFATLRDNVSSIKYVFLMKSKL
jgi:hypothetical protein